MDTPRNNLEIADTIRISYEDLHKLLCERKVLYRALTLAQTRCNDQLTEIRRLKRIVERYERALTREEEKEIPVEGREGERSLVQRRPGDQ